MVYGIVKGHGGLIQCYSETGVGTTFKLYFPVTETQIELDAGTTQELAVGGTETLLVVDDEKYVRVLGERILSGAGYTVLTAANGLEALKVYRENKEQISLVVLDLIMPEMGGMECLKELLRLNPKVKVVVASGFSASGPRNQAVEEGAKGFVGKPFGVRELLLTVRQALDRD
jgi:CheY-like chemotaxis protein